MKQLILAVGAVTLFVTPAVAQLSHKPGPVIAFGGGFSIPSSGDLDEVANTGMLIGGYAAGPLKGAFGWRVDGSWSHFGEPEVQLAGDVGFVCDLSACDRAKAFHIGGGVQLGGFNSASGGPYVFATVGAYNFRFGDASDTSTGVGLGTGYNWSVNERWAVGLQFTQNGFWPKDSDTQWYSATSFLAVYRW